MEQGLLVISASFQTTNCEWFKITERELFMNIPAFPVGSFPHGNKQRGEIMGGKDFLKKAFPFLSVAASAFSGPVGIAGANVLGAILGKDVKQTGLADELTKLTLSEEGRLKAAEAEQAFKLAMERMGFAHAEELEKVAASDRASARDREVKTGDKTPKILAATVVGAYFIVQTVLLFHVVEPTMRELVARVLGTLDASLMLVLGYYFGSSAGSAKKDDALSKV